MRYIYMLQDLVSIESLGILLELLLVTICISTIIFILSKNQYVSYLASVPVMYFISWLQYGSSHLFLLIVAMTVQAMIIIIIQHHTKKKTVVAKQGEVI
ncbi:hypothetical protein [Sporosarcina sp. NPDC096371]|uniref:hypothetical protein n=1 Tax=Sporosarcina sp. NPDC096371 TaxID=3364530 RepID=UPI003814F007